MCEPLETQNANIYSFCQPAGLLHDIVPAPPSKSSAVIGRSENDVAGVSGGRGSIVSYWASFGARLAGVAGVWGVGGGDGELFYGTDVVTGSLRRGTRS